MLVQTVVVTTRSELLVPTIGVITVCTVACTNCSSDDNVYRCWN